MQKPLKHGEPPSGRTSVASQWARVAVVLAIAIGLAPVIVEATQLGHKYLTGGAATTTYTDTSETKTTTSGTESTRRHEIVTAPNDDWMGRALGDWGLLFLRGLFVVLGAFLIGAVVQRVILGNYAFKAAGIELAPIPDLPKAEEALQLPSVVAIEIQTTGIPDKFELKRRELSQRSKSASGVPAILDQIEGGPSDFFLIDLEEGKSWLTTRLCVRPYRESRSLWMHLIAREGDGSLRRLRVHAR